MHTVANCTIHTYKCTQVHTHARTHTHTHHARMDTPTYQHTPHVYAHTCAHTNIYRYKICRIQSNELFIVWPLSEDCDVTSGEPWTINSNIVHYLKTSPGWLYYKSIIAIKKACLQSIQKIWGVQQWKQPCPH